MCKTGQLLPLRRQLPLPASHLDASSLRANISLIASVQANSYINYPHPHFIYKQLPSCKKALCMRFLAPQEGYLYLVSGWRDILSMLPSPLNHTGYHALSMKFRPPTVILPITFPLRYILCSPPSAFFKRESKLKLLFLKVQASGCLTKKKN